MGLNVVSDTREVCPGYSGEQKRGFSVLSVSSSNVLNRNLSLRGKLE